MRILQEILVKGLKLLKVEGGVGKESIGKNRKKNYFSLYLRETFREKKIENFIF